MTCGMCGEPIEGARQKRYCRPCRNTRYTKTTRYLEPGERIPDEEPGRFPTPRGYIRLRWRVAPYTYVETYEHRVFDGRVTRAEHVHHKDGDKSNNCPTNLEKLTRDEHHRKHHNLEWRREAASLYRQGLSTYQIAKIVNRDPSNVWRGLVRDGVIIPGEVST